MRPSWASDGAAQKLKTVPSVAIVAGEASGDASGAALAKELKRLRRDITIWGAGGPRMREAGVELVADFSWVSAIGIVESLKLAPKLLGELAKLKREVLDRRPDVFVPIDFGAFNVKLGRFVREQNIPSVYYFPPGSWRRRPKDPTSLLSAAEKIITPFPWSRDFLVEQGADAVFVGHPMLDRVAPSRSKKEMQKALDLRKDARIIGLLPGSRSHEIKHILPALIKAGWITANHLQVRTAFLMPASSERAVKHMTKIMLDLVPKLHRERLRREKELGMYDELEDPLIQFRVVRDATYDVMAHSELLITCSGTATIEAMILGTPMIIVYRGSKIMKVEYLLRGKRILEEFIGMPNIIAGREICPELLGDQASPEAIAEMATDFLETPERLRNMRRELQAARAVLGEPGGTSRAAKEVLQAAGLL